MMLYLLTRLEEFLLSFIWITLDQIISKVLNSFIRISGRNLNIIDNTGENEDLENEMLRFGLPLPLPIQSD
jgi:hypothetical protein